MTSRENNKQTIEFFEKRNYFGYPKEHIRFFVQGELPMIAQNGKILLDEEGLVKKAANGHGGTLLSMEKEKVIEELKKEGKEWVFICGVDNILANLADELFLGMTISKGASSGVKCIEKIDPKEKVGIFCKKNGKIGVIEYTEIPDDMAELRDEEGKLIYSNSNIVSHLYSIKDLEKVTNMKLPYHIAVKKAKYMNEKGDIVESKEPDCYKFETFIFDSFELLDDIAILNVKREEEFAPIKNASGIDSPETARKLYLDYYNK